jgi:hypothetical protein
MTLIKTRAEVEAEAISSPEQRVIRQIDAVLRLENERRDSTEARQVLSTYLDTLRTFNQCSLSMASAAL